MKCAFSSIPCAPRLLTAAPCSMHMLDNAEITLDQVQSGPAMQRAHQADLTAPCKRLINCCDQPERFSI